MVYITTVEKIGIKKGFQKGREEGIQSIAKRAN